MSPGVCDGVAPHAPALPGLQCVEYPVHMAAGDFGSVAFAKLVNAKTEIGLIALAKGYSVFLVDSDVALLKNPLPLLRASSADLQIQVSATAVIDVPCP